MLRSVPRVYIEKRTPVLRIAMILLRLAVEGNTACKNLVLYGIAIK